MSARIRHGDRVLCELERFVSPISARAVVRVALKRRGVSAQQLEREGLDERLVREIVLALRFYCDDVSKQLACKQNLAALTETAASSGPARIQIEVTDEQDIVRARSEARSLAERMGFGATDQIKIATVVSELTRNICRYAGHGRVRVEEHPGQVLLVVAEDEGPGIENVDEIMSGAYDSRTGLGLGLLGCRRIMDEFDIESRPGKGTRIRVTKRCRP